MLKLLATPNDYGGYDLTIAGYTVLSVIMVAIFLLGVFLTNRKQKQLKSKELAFCSLSLAIAFVLGTFVKLFRMPMGGSVTLFSMLFVTLIGYWYGLKTGLMAAIAYGLLQFVTNPWIVSIPQVFFDYIFAYGSLGLSGIFHNKKHGLIIGYLTGVAGRFVFSFLSGIIFFAASSAEAGAEYGMSMYLYSAVYNIAYLGVEALMTVILLLLPPIQKALGQVKILSTVEK